MTIFYVLLVAAAYGCCCALFDTYRALRFGNDFLWSGRADRSDFWPPEDGTKVRLPKTPFSGGGDAAARVEIDGNALSRVP
jgi:hypothetical protein